MNDLKDPTTRGPGEQPEKEWAQKKTEGTGEVWTGGRNLQEKEGALQCRLQMATITWTGIEDVAGEHGKRMAEMLRGIAATAGVLLSQKEGNVGEVVEGIVGTLRVPRIDSDMIRAYVGQRRQVEGAEVLERVAREGVPEEIRTGGDLRESAGLRESWEWGEVRRRGAGQKAVDVVLDSAIVFPATRRKDIVG